MLVVEKNLLRSVGENKLLRCSRLLERCRSDNAAAADVFGIMETLPPDERTVWKLAVLALRKHEEAASRSDAMILWLEKTRQCVYKAVNEGRFRI